MLVQCIRGTLIWQPENSANIWNLLWLSRRLIISIEQTSIYVSTFPDALTSKMAQNHEICKYQTRSTPCVTHLHNPEIQNAQVSKRSTLLSCKTVNRYKMHRLLCLIRIKTGGSLVSDFRK